MTAHRKPADEAATTFVRRHIGPSPRDVSAMLETVGAKSLRDLIGQTLPSSIRQKAPLDLGRALSETEALAHMRELASRNEVFTSLIGQGYSGTILPAVIQRNILENPAW
jgi:glycine dehydrogenase